MNRIHRTVIGNEYDEDFCDEARRIRLTLATKVLNQVSTKAKQNDRPFSLELEKLVKLGLCMAEEQS